MKSKEQPVERIVSHSTYLMPLLGYVAANAGVLNLGFYSTVLGLILLPIGVVLYIWSCAKLISEIPYCDVKDLCEHSLIWLVGLLTMIFWVLILVPQDGTFPWAARFVVFLVFAAIFGSFELGRIADYENPVQED